MFQQEIRDGHCQKTTSKTGVLTTKSPYFFKIWGRRGHFFLTLSFFLKIMIFSENFQNLQKCSQYPRVPIGTTFGVIESRLDILEHLTLFYLGKNAYLPFCEARIFKSRGSRILKFGRNFSILPMANPKIENWPHKNLLFGFLWANGTGFEGAPVKFRKKRK